MIINKYEEKKEITEFGEIDCQDRSRLITNLYQLIESTQSSLVLSVEAPWGCGKTFFAKYCEAEFKKKGAFTIYFNVWESDYSEDPFIVFYDEISKIIEKETHNNKKLLKVYDKYKDVGLKIIKYSLPLVIKLLTNGLIDIGNIKGLFKGRITDDDISSALSKVAEEELSAYQNKKGSILEFKKILSEIVENIQVENGEKRIFSVFIDELDRCRPDYAVELIENIKHLFSIDGITFILFLDVEQLKESIKTLYGNMDADGYLKRFFDYRILLPKPQLQSYGDYLYKEYRLKKIFNQNKTGNIADWFVFLTRPFNISLRDLEKMYYEFNIVINTHTNFKNEMPSILIMLIVLKHKKPDLYARIHEAGFHIADLDKLFGKNQSTEYLAYDDYWLKIRPYLMINLLKSGSLDMEINRLIKIEKDDNEKMVLRQRAGKILNVLSNQFNQVTYKNFIDSLLTQIDFVSDIFITNEKDLNKNNT